MYNDLISGADQAASFLGLKRRDVYRLVENGHLPVVRKGRRLFFRKSELERSFSGTMTELHLSPSMNVDLMSAPSWVKPSQELSR